MTSQQRKLTPLTQEDEPASQGLASYVTPYIRRYLEQHHDECVGYSLYDNIIREVERALFQELFQRTSGNKKKMAELLGLHRNTMRRKLQALGISE